MYRPESDYEVSPITRIDSAQHIVTCTNADIYTYSRGIDAGSKHDLDDLCAAITATQMSFTDIIDSVEPWEKAEQALQYIWEGKQVGKVVIRL